MKFVTILAMLCAVIVLSAAETALWDGSKNIFKAASTVTTSIDNGVVTFTGMSAQPGGKYSYIWPKMNIAPTVFKGKKHIGSAHDLKVYIIVINVGAVIIAGYIIRKRSFVSKR